MKISKGVAINRYMFRVTGSKKEILDLTVTLINNQHIYSVRESETSYLIEYIGRTHEEARDVLLARLKDLGIDTDMIENESSELEGN